MQSRIHLQEASWWRTIDDAIECYLCPRHCKIREGHYGFCNIRQNLNNRLYAIAYAHPVAVHVDPIEKKPMYHFYPGSRIFSVGTIGCNLACKFCQNWDISRAAPENIGSREFSPQEIVSHATRAGCIGIAFTYNEPTIFGEYVLDIAKLAHASGLKTVMVTNGYISAEAVVDIYPHIDAANVDLKSFSQSFYQRYCNGNLQPVLDTLQAIQKLDTFIEVTTLVIPGLNDSDTELTELTQWIVENIGADTPLHLSAFHPCYQLMDLPRTPKSTLDRARQIARQSGLRFVYEGNVMSYEENNTYCYACGRLLIERSGFAILSNRINGDKCVCGAKIAVVQ
jgi:pyruvate formate lyase activating enzyme